MNKRETVFISSDVVLGKDVQLLGFANLYGCRIGDETRIGPFVEIQSEVTIGARCKISSHTFICSGVTIGDECFIGHGVMFINDRTPATVNENGELKRAQDWVCEKTEIGRRVAIGSGAVIMCGIKIGDGAMIGAGAVVTQDVGSGQTVVGVPARQIQK